jgi:hypothetical protein
MKQAERSRKQAMSGWGGGGGGHILACKGSAPAASLGMGYGGPGKGGGELRLDLQRQIEEGQSGVSSKWRGLGSEKERDVDFANVVYTTTAESMEGSYQEKLVPFMQDYWRARSVEPAGAWPMHGPRLLRHRRCESAFAESFINPDTQVAVAGADIIQQIRVRDGNARGILGLLLQSGWITRRDLMAPKCCCRPVGPTIHLLCQLSSSTNQPLAPAELELARVHDVCSVCHYTDQPFCFR